MRGVYADGQIQALAERVLAMATQLDDAGSIDVFFFGTEAWHAGEFTIMNYQGGVDRLREGYRLGRTDYAGAIRAVREHFGLIGMTIGHDLPVYVLFLTDGAPTSRSAAEAELRAAAHYPAFWKFLSIGEEEITFLQKLDGLAGRAGDNTDYQPVGDLTLLKDQALVDLLLTEYDTWLVTARELRMLAGPVGSPRWSESASTVARTTSTRRTR